MKRNLIPLLLPVTLCAGNVTALGQMRITHAYTPGVAIPDAGEVVDSRSFGIAGSKVTEVTVSLDIVGYGFDGGYNGDLYAALSHGSAYSVLLNRTGKATPTGSGYSDDGFHVTLSDSAVGDIHNYRSVLNGSDGIAVPGGPSGTWQPDGRIASPDPVVSSSPRTALLSVLNGQDAGGEWRLLLSDHSAGATSKLVGWSLAVTTDSVGTGAQSFSSDLVEFLGLSQILSGPLTLIGQNTFKSAFDTRFDGQIDGSGGLVSSGAGELGLYGANSFSGGTRLQSGTLTVGNNSALGSGSLSLEGGTFKSAVTSLTLPNSVTAQAVSTINASTALTLAGSISGSADLHKTGTARLTLSSPSSLHSGTWYVDAGTLEVSGSIANAAVRVGSGAMLTGGGTVGGTTITSGGTLSPGQSAGQISLGNTVWQGGGTYAWQIDDATGTAGNSIGWDLAQINGSLSITATSLNRFTFTVSSLSPVGPGYSAGDAAHFNAGQSYSWRVASTTQGVSGYSADQFLLDTSGFSNDTLGGSFSLELSGNNLNLSFTAVPEPGTYATMIGSMLGLFALHRRRSRRWV